MLLFSHFSEGAHAPIDPALSLSAVSPPHLVLGAPAAGPSRAARAAPSPEKAKLAATAAPPPAPPQSRGSAPGRSSSGASWCRGPAHSPFLQLLRPPSAYSGGEGEGEREGKERHRCSQHLPAPPVPRLPSAVSILIPRAGGASAAKCWQDAPERGGPGCGRRGAQRAWGLRARPRTRPHPRRRERCRCSAPPPPRHGAAPHRQPPGTRWEKWVPVPSPAPTGCGSWLREEEEEEGGKERGGREGEGREEVEMLLWAGDITARWLEPAASSVRGSAEAAHGLFVPPEDPAVAIEEGSREQAACPAPPPPPPLLLLLLLDRIYRWSPLDKNQEPG